MKSRGYNFGGGPAMLPLLVLEEAQREFLNWHHLDMSILEVGHRTPEFMDLMAEAEADFRELLHIPNEYHVLFLGGPARMQFAMAPMNLLAAGEEAGYLVSGVWSALAFKEAQKIKKAYCVASSAQNNFHEVPRVEDWQIKEKTKYLYYTPNETVNGNRFTSVPRVSGLPLIADMTSCLLSEPLNINDYGLIFAGAQKNISTAGLTIVIIRADLLEGSNLQTLPTMLDYKTQIDNHSLYATPPGFNCYLAAKMFKWVKAQGGVAQLYELNCQKAHTLYQYIDESTFYSCPVTNNARSLVNICFNLINPELQEAFLLKANQQGLYALKGHRMVGGLRASLYNAMPMDGVLSLISFMQGFSEEYQR